MRVADFKEDILAAYYIRKDMTVGDLKSLIKDLDDDIPIYLANHEKIQYDDITEFGVFDYKDKRDRFAYIKAGVKEK